MSVRWITWAWEQDCSSAGVKLTLIALADHAGEEGRAFPGCARLAEKTGQATGTIRRHLDELEESGLLSRERRRKGNGQLGTYDYQLNQRADTPTGEIDPQPARTRERAEPSEEPSDIARAASDAEFELFWTTYGRVGPKKVARQCWDKALKKATADEIMTGLDRWVDYWQKPGAANVKWPQGWLNEERWTSDPPPVREDTRSARSSVGASRAAQNQAVLDRMRERVS